MEEEEGEWILETVFYCENNGVADMAFFITLDTLPTLDGKHFNVKQGKSIRVTLKEMLPDGYQDMEKLEGISSSISAKNLSEDKEGAFQIIIEGPFKPELSVEEKRLIPIGNKLLKDHQNAIYKGAASDRRALVKDALPEEYKFKTDLYTSLCHTRGKMFSSLLLLDEADASFETGWEKYYVKLKWFYCIDWAHALILYLNVPININEKKVKIDRAIVLLEEFKVWSKSSTYQKYNNIAADGMIAFCYCYLAKHDEAKKIMSGNDYTSISIIDMNNEGINSFYDYYGYAIAAAIELKDGELLKRICELIRFEKKDIDPNLNAWRCLKMTFGHIRQNGKTQIKTLFDIFKEYNTNYYPELANLTAFLKLMKRNDEAGMEKYFM